jgi:predicted nucleotide-binding protein
VKTGREDGKRRGARPASLPDARPKGALDSGPMPQRLRRPRPEVESIIDRAIEKGDELLEGATDVGDEDSYEAWVRWHADTREALNAAFEGDEMASEFYDVATGGPIYIGGGDASAAEIFEDRKKATRGAINTLRSMRERLEFAEAPTTEQARGAESEAGALPRRVFVVHGRDEALCDEVAQVLERLDLEALILMKQPGRGQTLIEKFEAGALKVGFAVVLFTPDDFGRGPDESEWPEQPNRARQNVVLELGYFMGRLGRPRVAALYHPGTEVPSDIHGLAYIELDESGVWRHRLAEELRAEGYEIDINQLGG